MNKFVVAAGAALLLTLGGVSSASAQATRTWVSGVGDDVNPCSRTAPCKTFAGAISKTAAGGEIDVLDPGGFGTLNITKSITIDGSGGSVGSVLSSSTNGFLINTVGVSVVLRNLTINGAGTGLNGVRFLQGTSLIIEHCNIMDSQAAGATDTGFGVQFAPSTDGELSIIDTTISGNGNAGGSTGAGIQIKPTSSGTARVSLSNVTSTNNVIGVRVDGSASTGAGITVAVKDSLFSNNQHSGVVAIAPSGGQAVSILLKDSTSTSNGVVSGAPGVRADGALATIRISNVNITGNSLGVSTANGGQLLSYGDNAIDGNTNNGTSPTIIAKH